jgi:hypothetical protein
VDLARWKTGEVGVAGIAEFPKQPSHLTNLTPAPSPQVHAAYGKRQGVKASSPSGCFGSEIGNGGSDPEFQCASFSDYAVWSVLPPPATLGVSANSRKPPLQRLPRCNMFAHKVPDSDRLGVRLGGSHPEFAAGRRSCSMVDQ